MSPQSGCKRSGGVGGISATASFVQILPFVVKCFRCVTEMQTLQSSKWHKDMSHTYWCFSDLDKLLEKHCGHHTSATVNSQLHGGDLTINLAHEMDDEVDELFPHILLAVEIGQKKR